MAAHQIQTLVKPHVFFKSWELCFQSSTFIAFATTEGKLPKFLTFTAVVQKLVGDEAEEKYIHFT